MDDEEVFIEDTESTEFDQIIGAIEDIAISDDFQALQNNLLETYCHHFEVISVLIRQGREYTMKYRSTTIFGLGLLFFD